MALPILTLQQELPTPGQNAAYAARLAAKSMGINPDDPLGVESTAAQVMAQLKAQGIDADPAMVKSLVGEALKSGGLVQKATDPVILC